MARIPVIAIFDVGKTNKKLFLFNEAYQIVYEKQARFIETKDEDGDVCEDVFALTQSLKESLAEVLDDERFDIRAINFSTYGASFVLLDNKGEVIAPLYNYLKPFPQHLEDQFYPRYGGRAEFARKTASPILGNLNSGLQLYRLKNILPEKFARVACALHLPQYMSYVISGNKCSDMTSIGCHTALWDFDSNAYHEWVHAEGILSVFAPISSQDTVREVSFRGNRLLAGIGLHDSSAALIPYLVCFDQPFVLISTGTWSISLNPFNSDPLTDEELAADCLSYLSFEGKPVKASRLFAGHFHDEAVKKIADYFSVSGAFYKTVSFDQDLLPGDLSRQIDPRNPQGLERYLNAAEAYHALVEGIVQLQEEATNRILTGLETQLFVDGGFSQNDIFMRLLARRFPALKVAAASVAQSTAMGTALAIHKSWNKSGVPDKLISLRPY